MTKGLFSRAFERDLKVHLKARNVTDWGVPKPNLERLWTVAGSLFLYLICPLLLFNFSGDLKIASNTRSDILIGLCAVVGLCRGLIAGAMIWDPDHVSRLGHLPIERETYLNLAIRSALIYLCFLTLESFVMIVILISVIGEISFSLHQALLAAVAWALLIFGISLIRLRFLSEKHSWVVLRPILIGIPTITFVLYLWGLLAQMFPGTRDALLSTYEMLGNFLGMLSGVLPTGAVLDLVRNPFSSEWIWPALLWAAAIFIGGLGFVPWLKEKYLYSDFYRDPTDWTDEEFPSYEEKTMLDEDTGEERIAYRYVFEEGETTDWIIKDKEDDDIEQVVRGPRHISETGWIEKLVNRSLSGDDRRLLDALINDQNLDWSSDWKRGWIGMGIILLVMGVFVVPDLPMSHAVFCVGLIVLFGVCMWRYLALNLRDWERVWLLPVRPADYFRLIWKLSMIRAVTAIPALAAAGAAVAWMVELNPMIGCLGGTAIALYYGVQRVYWMNGCGGVRSQFNSGATFLLSKFLSAIVLLLWGVLSVAIVAARSVPISRMFLIIFAALTCASLVAAGAAWIGLRLRRRVRWVPGNIWNDAG